MPWHYAFCYINKVSFNWGSISFLERFSSRMNKAGDTAFSVPQFRMLDARMHFFVFRQLKLRLPIHIL